MTPPTLWRLKEAGYVVHEDGRPNIIAHRSATRTPDAFDDWIQVIRKIDGEWVSHLWACTVDPGLPWMISPMNAKGAARLAPGQWRFQVGHRSQERGGYRCLVQADKVTVLRDADLDDEIDGDLQDTGWFGIQIHRADAAGTGTKVGRWSAGCVVLPLSEEAFQKDFMAFVVGGLLFDDEEVLVTVLEDVRVRL